MDTTTSLVSNSPSLIFLTRHSRSQSLLPQRHGSLSFHPIISCTSSSSSSNNTNDDDDTPVQASTATPASAPKELRIRRISKRQARKQRGVGTVTEQQTPKVKAPPKKWEEMNLTEKAIELYVGEKGALFWLNKFAYASIFIMIGVWILFRFVGPALNVYQLDSPLLSPEAVLKGSS